jgi:homoserine dehydrogenase
LIGCGTVGSGVARLLLEQGDRFEARAGRLLHLRRILVRDPSKDRGVWLPPGMITTNLEEILTDPEIHVGVELVGGVDWALSAIRRLLEAGKDVVTANKALLAEHGNEVFAMARQHRRALAFEASVAGGIPILAALTHGLAANQILAIQAILNGTCNFILTAMTEIGQSYNAVLAEAQELGYAEADPTLDVDGTDAAHKLAILTQLAFGISVPPGQIARRGIAEIAALDIRFAGELGYVIKLLAEAWLDTKSDPPQLAIHVSPVLLRRQTPLAQVRGVYNAIAVTGDIVGDTLFYGRGAGQMPTASAVTADLIDLASSRSQRFYQTKRLFRSDPPGGDSDLQKIVLSPPATVPTRFYLRLLVEDRPGVLAEVAGVLAEHRVSIASVIQHEVPDEQEGEWVHLVIMTHAAPTGAFQKACERMGHLKDVTPPVIYYPVSD